MIESFDHQMDGFTQIQRICMFIAIAIWKDSFDSAGVVFRVVPAVSINI
ncbi:MAG: hypothetical protein Q8S54_00430 [Bacteroidota bacterium]|nr:hypothetical protein [Bacteroidota bacterium]